MKTPFSTTAREMLQDWATDIAIFIIGAALLVFLTASFNRTIAEFSLTEGNPASHHHQGE